jgi:hypothetical protein
MRFRLALPLLNVILGAVLFWVGDLQIERVAETCGPHCTEGVPDDFATAKYVDYALNAPAWIFRQEAQVRMFWAPDIRQWIKYRGSRWGGLDLWYFLAVVVMWYCLGLWLDNRFGSPRPKTTKKTKAWLHLFAFACMSYGFFMWWRIYPQFVPLRRYGHWLPLRQYPDFSIAAVVLWGGAMVVFGFRALFWGIESRA